MTGDPLAGPGLRTLCFHCCGLGSFPGQGTKVPQAERIAKGKKEKKMLNDNENYDISL